MSRGRWALYGIIGVGVALGAAFAVVHTLVIAPRVRRGEVEEEVKQWGQTWSAARHCLTGEPRSSDPLEAIVARELVNPNAATALARCAGALRELPRKPGYHSESAAVEQAWEKVTERLDELAMAHAIHTAKERQSSDSAALRGRLAAAIAGMDDALRALRSAAGLPAAAAPARRLPAAAPVPIAPELTVSSLEVTANAVIVTGTAEGSERSGRITSLPPRPGDLFPLAPLVVVAASSGERWGIDLPEPAPGAPATVVATPLDQTGLPTGTPALLAMLAPGASAAGLFALGDGPTRAAIYELQLADGPRSLRVAHSTDGGHTWSDVLARDAADLRTDRARRRADIVWRDEDDLLQWLELRPDGLAPPVRPRLLGPASMLTADAPSLCAAAAGPGAWWDLGQILLHATADAIRPVPDSWLALPARATVCDGERLFAAVESKDAPGAITAVTCAPTGCQKLSSLPLPLDASVVAALGPARGAVFGVWSPPVLAIWTARAGAPAKLAGLVRLDSPDGPTGLVEWDGALHAVDQVGDQVRVSALPL